jgi:hypothetical protein
MTPTSPTNHNSIESARQVREFSKLQFVKGILHYARLQIDSPSTALKKNIITNFIRFDFASV